MKLMAGDIHNGGTMVWSYSYPVSIYSHPRASAVYCMYRAHLDSTRLSLPLSRVEQLPRLAAAGPSVCAVATVNETGPSGLKAASPLGRLPSLPQARMHQCDGSAASLSANTAASRRCGWAWILGKEGRGRAGEGPLMLLP